MAHASGLVFPSFPSSLRQRNLSLLGVSRSGFSQFGRIHHRVLCCLAFEGQKKNVSDLSLLPMPRLVTQGCKLIGCGSAVPDLLVSNDDLANIVNTSDEWISVRTGIRNRRILSGKDSLTGLAAAAAKNALQMAKVEPDDVDLVLMCTSTPEDLFGSAPQIQRALGCTRNPLAYDITAACSGFILGLISAACHIRGGGFKNVLVIGADSLSRHVDWTDRSTCILFGDAAGAVVVQDIIRIACMNTADMNADECFYVGNLFSGLTDAMLLSKGKLQYLACDGNEDGLFSFDLHSDGDGQRHLNASIKEGEPHDGLGSNGSVVGFPPRRAAYSFIEMNGKEVFRFAVRCVPQSIESALEKASLTSSNIDWLLLHQANQRIIDAVATRLDVPPERVISNLADYGNTSAASIPLALDEAVRSGKVQSGHIIAAAGFGAGVTWGSAIMRWG
ncbi:hypothetical protein Syun_009452 [Stephania yunnanensis]|uniref:Uncharacterized protein n=1 Tax=Stephania yunnanensis TaxID=152371 RepID=A0AAP0KG63_9MAGN